MIHSEDLPPLLHFENTHLRKNIPKYRKDSYIIP